MPVLHEGLEGVDDRLLLALGLVAGDVLGLVEMQEQHPPFLEEGADHLPDGVGGALALERESERLEDGPADGLERGRRGDAQADHVAAAIGVIDDEAGGGGQEPRHQRGLAAARGADHGNGARLADDAGSDLGLPQGKQPLELGSQQGEGRRGDEGLPQRDDAPRDVEG